MKAETRMKFIESAILKYGFISRSLISSVFEISEPQATRDLMCYRKLNDGLVFIGSSKQWAKAENFQATKDLLHTTPDEFISALEVVMGRKIQQVAVKTRLGAA